MTGPTVLLADQQLLFGLFGVLRVAAEVDPDKGLVADHPGVVAGTDRGEVAGADVALRAVVHHDMHLSADRVDQVGRLAAIRAGDRLHVLRPAPAGLPRACHRRVVADLHDLLRLPVVRATQPPEHPSDRDDERLRSDCESGIECKPKHDVARSQRGPAGRACRLLPEPKQESWLAEPLVTLTVSEVLEHDAG